MYRQKKIIFLSFLLSFIIHGMLFTYGRSSIQSLIFPRENYKQVTFEMLLTKNEVYPIIVGNKTTKRKLVLQTRKKNSKISSKKICKNNKIGPSIIKLIQPKYPYMCEIEEIEGQLICKIILKKGKIMQLTFVTNNESQFEEAVRTSLNQSIFKGNGELTIKYEFLLEK